MKAIGEAEFRDRWAEQHREWEQISLELRDRGDGAIVTAYDVTLEQRKRRLARGETMVGLGDEGGYVEVTPSEDAARRKPFDDDAVRDLEEG